MVLSCFTPNYPQRKGTFLDSIFVPTEKKRNKILPGGNESTKECPSWSLHLNLLSKKHRKVTVLHYQQQLKLRQKVSWIWPSLQEYILSLGLQKLFQKFMNTSSPRIAKTINITYISKGWADVIICILYIEKLSFEEVKWVFPIILFTWDHSVFIEMKHFPSLTDPTGIKR